MVSWRASVDRIRSLWDSETAASELVLCCGTFLGTTVAALLLARLGQAETRWGAALVLVFAPVPLILCIRASRRRRIDPSAIIRATLLHTQPEVGHAALRAHRLALLSSQENRRGSSELAALHFLRTLKRANMPDIGRRARLRAWLLSIAALAIGLAALLTVVRDPLRMLEGFNLLWARGGKAPIAMPWVASLEVTSNPPSYLELPQRRLRPYYPAALHRGTVVTVRAIERHPDRTLFLSDGVADVPFHEDGEGGVVAHWTISDDVSLRISARYGESRIAEPRHMELHCIPDLPPRVKLETAPKTITLLEQGAIPIHYEASDDHGLREVVLVLRSGTHEQRRELSRPQGSTRDDRGGTTLLANDAFLRRSYLPVEVAVHARDGDPVAGPNWGHSAAIVIIPPGIAEREVLRYLALRQAQNAATDLLAMRLLRPSPKPSERHAYLREQTRAQRKAEEALLVPLNQDFGGLWLRGPYAMLVRGQIRRLANSLKKAQSMPARQATRSLIETSESVLLAINAAVDALAHRDSQRAANQLSEVALDAAQAIALRRELKQRSRAERHLEATLSILVKGGNRLLELGRLGHDLGEIVANGTRRIGRALAADDNYHAKLAAEDLAARLRHPQPSFDSSSGGEAPVEAGGPPGDNATEPSEATREIAELHRSLEQLRQDHASEILKVQRALQQAQPEGERQKLRDKLRKHAQSIRQAIGNLPQQAAQPGSAKATAAQGRSEAEAMAGALEQGDLERAIRSGKDAQETLQRAARLGRRAPANSPNHQTARQAAAAGAKLSESTSEASRLLDAQQRQASSRAQAELAHAGQRERELAKEASELRRRNASSEVPLPDDMQRKLGDAAEAMRRAGRRFERTKGSEGLALQKYAQRLLEMAFSEPERKPDGNTGPDGENFAQQANVPGDTDDQSAAAFRRRVSDGLRRSAPAHLRDAVRRYAEGLLR